MALYALYQVSGFNGSKFLFLAKFSKYNRILFAVQCRSGLAVNPLIFDCSAAWLTKFRLRFHNLPLRNCWSFKFITASSHEMSALTLYIFGFTGASRLEWLSYEKVTNSPTVGEGIRTSSWGTIKVVPSGLSGKRKKISYSGSKVLWAVPTILEWLNALFQQRSLLLLYHPVQSENR